MEEKTMRRFSGIGNSFGDSSLPQAKLAIEQSSQSSEARFVIVAAVQPVAGPPPAQPPVPLPQRPRYAVRSQPAAR